MKELAVRALSGSVYVVLVLGAAWVGPWATAILFLPISALAAQEWHRLRWGGTSGTAVSISILVAVSAYALLTFASFTPAPHIIFRLIALLLVLAMVAVILLFRSSIRRVPSSQTAGRSQDLLMITLGIAMPFACATWFTRLDPMFFIGFMLLLWTNDTGAYLVGKSIGRNKLMPKVSPGKTWEGLLGGIALTALVAWFWAVQCPALSRTVWVVAAVVVSIAATAGDLFESAMERAAGVKDSGTIMPGHGGVLDRFDGYLLAAPAMVVVAFLLD